MDPKWGRGPRKSGHDATVPGHWETQVYGETASEGWKWGIDAQLGPPCMVDCIQHQRPSGMMIDEHHPGEAQQEPRNWENHSRLHKVSHPSRDQDPCCL